MTADHLTNLEVVSVRHSQSSREERDVGGKGRTRTLDPGIMSRLLGSG
jgi:hypothetical protein